MYLRENLPLNLEALRMLIADPTEMFLVWPAARWPFDAAQWQEVFDADPQNRSFFAEDSGWPIGHAALLEDDDDHESFQVSFVYLAPAWRGGGHARSMLRTLEDYARSRFGALRLTLAVRDYNLPARRCYAMAGFREHSCDGSLIRMHKVIGPAG